MDSKRILIVEDEFVIAMDIASILKSMGHTVVGIVNNGVAAIATAMRDSPDLLVMDVNIKGDMTGVEALRKIWLTRIIPVIFLTGYERPSILQEEIGEYVGYIVKPFETEELQDAVEGMMQSGVTSLRYETR